MSHATGAGGEPATPTESELRRQAAGHIAACRRAVPVFVAENFGLRGALRLNRSALGRDLWVAPLNFLLGFPNFLLRLLALLLELLRARRAARWLLRSHLGLHTTVQQVLTERLMGDLLGLPRTGEAPPWRAFLAEMAREPVAIYVRTRNVAADITAGTLAAVSGLIFLHQFTPGSISAGTAVARLMAREEAVSAFPLGEVAGRLYYGLFPPAPSLGVVLLALLLVATVIAVVSAFAGFLHDPVQAVTGLHQRRLHQLLDAIEASVDRGNTKGYRPRDTFFGRVYDVVDWVKGFLSF